MLVDKQRQKLVYYGTCISIWARLGSEPDVRDWLGTYTPYLPTQHARSSPFRVGRSPMWRSCCPLASLPRYYYCLWDNITVLSDLDLARETGVPMGVVSSKRGAGILNPVIMGTCPDGHCRR